MSDIKVFVKIKEPKKVKTLSNIEYAEIGIIISCHFSDEVIDYSEDLIRDIKKLVKKYKNDRFQVKEITGKRDIRSR